MDAVPVDIARRREVARARSARPWRARVRRSAPARDPRDLIQATRSACTERARSRRAGLCGPLRSERTEGRGSSQRVVELERSAEPRRPAVGPSRDSRMKRTPSSSLLWQLLHRRRRRPASQALRSKAASPPARKSVRAGSAPLVHSAPHSRAGMPRLTRGSGRAGKRRRHPLGRARSRAAPHLEGRAPRSQAAPR